MKANLEKTVAHLMTLNPEMSKAEAIEVAFAYLVDKSGITLNS